jgi:hypothetical protein
MANIVYNAGKKYLLNGAVDCDTDTINVMLVTSSYTPDQDTHAYRSDVTNEVSGAGYSTGGAALVNKSITQDNTNNKAYLDANDLTWTTSTITARAAVIYKARGGLASADELLGYVDFGSDKSSSSGDFTIQWAATGILEIA